MKCFCGTSNVAPRKRLTAVSFMMSAKWITGVTHTMNKLQRTTSTDRQRENSTFKLGLEVYLSKLGEWDREKCGSLWKLQETYTWTVLQAYGKAGEPKKNIRSIDCTHSFHVSSDRTNMHEGVKRRKGGISFVRSACEWLIGSAVMVYLRLTNHCGSPKVILVVIRLPLLGTMWGCWPKPAFHFSGA